MPPPTGRPDFWTRCPVCSSPWARFLCTIRPWPSSRGILQSGSNSSRTCWMGSWSRCTSCNVSPARRWILWGAWVIAGARIRTTGTAAWTSTSTLYSGTRPRRLGGWDLPGPSSGTACGYWWCSHWWILYACWVLPVIGFCSWNWNGRGHEWGRNSL